MNFIFCGIFFEVIMLLTEIDLIQAIKNKI